MQKTAAFLMVSVLLLGLFLMGEARHEPAAGIDAAYADWIATNSARATHKSRVVLVEINDNTVSSQPWPWSAKEFALFLQAVLPQKPDIVAIEPVLDWQNAPGAQKSAQFEKVLHDFLLQAPKVVLASRLGAPDDPDVVPAMQPVPFLRHVNGDTTAIPAFTDIPEQPREDYRPTAAIGFANPPGDGNITRRIPLVFNYRGEIVPSFTLQILIQWYKLTIDDVTVEPGSRIILGNKLQVPIDRAGRMNLDFGAGFTRFGDDDLLLAVTEQQQNAAKRTSPASLDSLKGGVAILARTDKESRTLLTPSGDRKSPGELCAIAVATAQNAAFAHRVTHIFDFSLIAFMMAASAVFHFVAKRKFLLYSFAFSLCYLFLSLSVYALALAWLPFVLPAGLLLLVNFFSLFITRKTAPLISATPAQPSAP